MRRKPKLVWHKKTPSCYITTFGQSGLTVSIQRVIGAKAWQVAFVFGKHLGNTPHFAKPEDAMAEAERLAQEHTRKLFNFWTML